MPTSTMHLHSPSELLTAIPYILGFQPNDSLVAIALHEGRLGLLCRIDLPDDSNTQRVVDALVPPLTREAPDRVILVGCQDETCHAELAFEALAAGLTDAGISVYDRLIVTGDGHQAGPRSHRRRASGARRRGASCAGGTRRCRRRQPAP